MSGVVTMVNIICSISNATADTSRLGVLLLLSALLASGVLLGSLSTLLLIRGLSNGFSNKR